MAGRAPGGTPATVALARTGTAHTLHRYRHDPRAESYGTQAATQLGVDPGRVLKTLVTSVDGRLVAAVVPVAGRLDLKALARSVGGARAALADPSVAERATGYVTGGISPFGQKRTLPTVVDASALEHATVYVSAGRRGLEVEIAPADLVEVTGAIVAAVAR